MTDLFLFRFLSVSPVSGKQQWTQRIMDAEDAASRSQTLVKHTSQEFDTQTVNANDAKKLFLEHQAALATAEAKKKEVIFSSIFSLPLYLFMPPPSFCFLLLFRFSFFPSLDICCIDPNW